MKQTALLEIINDHIKRTLELALERNMLDDDLAKRVRMNHNIPYRKLQCLILTSESFLNMSMADAADVMDVSVDYVAHSLTELRTQYPQLTVFEGVWKSDDRAGSLKNPLSLDSVIADNNDAVVIHKF